MLTINTISNAGPAATGTAVPSSVPAAVAAPQIQQGESGNDKRGSYPAESINETEKKVAAAVNIADVQGLANSNN